MKEHIVASNAYRRVNNIYYSGLLINLMELDFLKKTSVLKVQKGQHLQRLDELVERFGWFWSLVRSQIAKDYFIEIFN